MASGRFDWIDIVPSVAFLIVGAHQLGLSQLTLDANIQVTDTLFSLGGVGVSIAFFLSFASIGVIAVTNEMDIGDLRDVAEGEYYTSEGSQMEEWARFAVIGMIGLVFGIEFVPGLESFVTSGDIIAIAALSVEAAGISFIAYGS